MNIDDPRDDLRAPARLTAALLARKGNALPSGFAAPPRTAGNAGPRGPRLAPESSGGGRCGDGPRARITLRLDETRHLRLKLTAAHLNRSLQDITTEALDRYLDQMSPEILANDCACLAAARAGRAKD